MDLFDSSVDGGDLGALLPPGLHSAEHAREEQLARERTAFTDYESRNRDQIVDDEGDQFYQANRNWRRQQAAVRADMAARRLLEEAEGPPRQAVERESEQEGAALGLFPVRLGLLCSCLAERHSRGQREAQQRAKLEDAMFAERSTVYDALESTGRELVAAAEADKALGFASYSIHLKLLAQSEAKRRQYTLQMQMEWGLLLDEFADEGTAVLERVESTERHALVQIYQKGLPRKRIRLLSFCAQEESQRFIDTRAWGRWWAERAELTVRSVAAALEDYERRRRQRTLEQWAADARRFEARFVTLHVCWDERAARRAVAAQWLARWRLETERQSNEFCLCCIADTLAAADRHRAAVAAAAARGHWRLAVQEMTASEQLQRAAIAQQWLRIWWRGLREAVSGAHRQELQAAAFDAAKQPIRAVLLPLAAAGKRAAARPARRHLAAGGATPSLRPPEAEPTPYRPRRRARPARPRCAAPLRPPLAGSAARLLRAAAPLLVAAGEDLSEADCGPALECGGGVRALLAASRRPRPGERPSFGAASGREAWGVPRAPLTRSR